MGVITKLTFSNVVIKANNIPDLHGLNEVILDCTEDFGKPPDYIDLDVFSFGRVSNQLTALIGCYPETNVTEFKFRGVTIRVNPRAHGRR